MIRDILKAEPRHVSRLRKSWYLVFLWFKCHQNPLSEGEMFDGCLMRAAQWRMGTDECREDHCVISHSCRQSQASGHTFPTFSRTFHKSIKVKWTFLVSIFVDQCIVCRPVYNQMSIWPLKQNNASYYSRNTTAQPTLSLLSYLPLLVMCHA